MSSEDPITVWLKHVAKGDERAIEGIWATYFDRLVRFAKSRLPPSRRRTADEEDVAISAMKSFVLRLQRPDCHWRLNDRHDLWKILIAIAARKASKQNRKQLAQKRGKGAVGGESALMARGADNLAGIEQAMGREPSPELAAQLVEEFEVRLASLMDEKLRAIAIGKMQGLTNREIADTVGISLRSVERKLELIRSKWEVEARE